jgi:hypothetical protein
MRVSYDKRQVAKIKFNSEFHNKKPINLRGKLKVNDAKKNLFIGATNLLYCLKIDLAYHFS